MDEITVRWPDADATETSYKRVRGNYDVTLRQDGGITYAGQPTTSGP